VGDIFENHIHENSDIRGRCFWRSRI